MPPNYWSSSTGSLNMPQHRLKAANERDHGDSQWSQLYTSLLGGIVDQGATHLWGKEPIKTAEEI